MDLKALQDSLTAYANAMEKPFAFSTEIMLALVEELGEVSQEIALLERIGSKAEWQKEPSRERLAEEISHVFNLVLALASHYQIDLDELYTRKLNSKSI